MSAADDLKILCIIRDLTNPQWQQCKITVNLPANTTCKELCEEVARQANYEAGTFSLVWQRGGQDGGDEVSTFPSLLLMFPQNQGNTNFLLLFTSLVTAIILAGNKSGLSKFSNNCCSPYQVEYIDHKPQHTSRVFADHYGPIYLKLLLFCTIYIQVEYIDHKSQHTSRVFANHYGPIYLKLLLFCTIYIIHNSVGTICWPCADHMLQQLHHFCRNPASSV